ncbi:arylesterase [Pedobacter psychrophilus]|uniref:Arylesterase n=1 Tax=Pedobacter psychrophilus TaxID=1826909 RepID=A0A179DDK6_9SPHI|nr:arylesterase [Pedobacter psychrophilus]OAQ39137.1 arylesterase [Pedobacter psychrophilus]
MLRITFALSLIIIVITSCGDNANKAKDTENPTTETTIVANTPNKNILFFGTSLTAGLGLNQSEAYPALIQHKIDSLNLNYKVINGGLSGETSAGGKSRIDWLLKQPISVFVLELGANDGLRGIPVKETRANLQAIINRVKEKYPDVIMVMEGMQMPPNMGEKYTQDFKETFSLLAKENDMIYVPFLLEGVGGVAKLNQDDGIHPTKEGQKILAENVWKMLKPALLD